MAWIESHTGLAQHPKTRKLANRLDIKIAEAVGLLHCLWHWAVEYAFDGDLTGWDAEDIAIGALWEGDPESFIKALLDSKGSSGHGFLEQDGERLVIHDWLSYTAHLRARRESAQKANHVRWHEQRNVEDPACEWCRTPDESEQNPNGDVPESTVPNRTEPKEEESPSFDAFWNSYPSRNGVKGSKKAAKGVWKSLAPPKRRRALETLPLYARAANGFPRDAERYLRHEMWDGLDAAAVAGGSEPEPDYYRSLEDA